MYIEGLEQAVEYLPKWEATLSLKKTDEDFTNEPIKVITKFIDDMRLFAADLVVEVSL